MKHTPWKLFYKHGVIEIQDQRGNVIVKWTGFDGADQSEPVKVANARLIAAAPELLEALRHIRKIVSPHLIGAEECDKLDAAIAKAKGE